MATEVNENTDLSMAALFVRKALFKNDAKGKKIEVRPARYVTATPVFSEDGFIVRQAAKRNENGDMVPASVTGGGSGDFFVVDLATHERFVERRGSFETNYTRCAMAEIPDAVKQFCSDHPLPGLSEFEIPVNEPNDQTAGI